MSLKSTHSTKLQDNLVPRVLSYPSYVGRVGENPGNEVDYRKSYSWLEPHTRSTEGFNGFLETREIEVSESEPVFKHNDNRLRPAFTTKNMVASLISTQFKKTCQ